MTNRCKKKFGVVTRYAVRAWRVWMAFKATSICCTTMHETRRGKHWTLENALVWIDLGWWPMQGEFKGRFLKTEVCIDD